MLGELFYASQRCGKTKIHVHVNLNATMSLPKSGNNTLFQNANTNFAEFQPRINEYSNKTLIKPGENTQKVILLA